MFSQNLNCCSPNFSCAIVINFALAHSESLSIIDLITILIIKGTFNGNFTLYICLSLVYFMRDISLTMNTTILQLFTYLFTHYSIWIFQVQCWREPNGNIKTNTQFGIPMMQQPELCHFGHSRHTVHPKKSPQMIMRDSNCNFYADSNSWSTQQQLQPLLYTVNAPANICEPSHVKHVRLYYHLQ